MVAGIRTDRQQADGDCTGDGQGVTDRANGAGVAFRAVKLTRLETCPSRNTLFTVNRGQEHGVVGGRFLSGYIRPRLLRSEEKPV